LPSDAAPQGFGAALSSFGAGEAGSVLGVTSGIATATGERDTRLYSLQPPQISKLHGSTALAPMMITITHHRQNLEAGIETGAQISAETLVTRHDWALAGQDDVDVGDGQVVLRGLRKTLLFLADQLARLLELPNQGILGGEGHVEGEDGRHVAVRPALRAGRR